MEVNSSSISGWFLLSEARFDLIHFFLTLILPRKRIKIISYKYYCLNILQTHVLTDIHGYMYKFRNKINVWKVFRTYNHKSEVKISSIVFEKYVRNCIKFVLIHYSSYRKKREEFTPVIFLLHFQSRNSDDLWKTLREKAPKY